jgi:predicted glycosyltransferase involved in capsule biosynthesis
MTIISSYRDRIESLRRFCDSVKNVDKSKFEFIVVSLGDDNDEAKRLCIDSGVMFVYVDYKKVFNTAKAHNIGVMMSSHEWIMKQDIDCVASDGFYEYLSKHLSDKDSNYYMCLGVYYLDEHGNKKNRTPEGNEFVFNRNLWNRINEFVEFDGYGWEDYATLYAFEKELDKNFVLSHYSESDINNTIKHEIRDKKNLQASYLGIYLTHYYHDRKTNTEYFLRNKDNKKLLYKYVMERNKCI